MCRSMSDINAELRETLYRMEKVSDDIAFMLMRGRLYDACKLANGDYLELYQKRSRLSEEWNERIEHE